MPARLLASLQSAPGWWAAAVIVWVCVVLWVRTLQPPVPSRYIERIRVRTVWVYLLRFAVVVVVLIIVAGGVLTLAVPGDFDPTLPPLYVTAAAALAAAARLTWSLDLFATNDGYVHAGAFVPWSAVDAIDAGWWAVTIRHPSWRRAAMLWAGRTILGRWYFAISGAALGRLRALWRGPPSPAQY